MKERGRGGDAAPASGAVGRALQIVSHRLVWPLRGVGTVPRSAVGIDLRIGRLGQGVMYILAVGQGRSPVGRRPHQRMPEPHPQAHLEQPGSLGRCRGASPDPEPLGCTPEQSRIADRFGSRRQQQPLALSRQRPYPAEKALLDTTRQWPRVREPEASRHLGRRQPPGELQQRQRVAARLRDDPVPHRLVQAATEHRGQQVSCVDIAEPFQHQFRQIHQDRFGARLANREHERDRLGHQATGNKRQSLQRSPIEPLRIVEEADQRLSLSDLGQQAEGGQTDHETIRDIAFRQPERHAQRITLRDRESLKLVEHRTAELMQTGKRELHLRLDAPDSYDE